MTLHLLRLLRPVLFRQWRAAFRPAVIGAVLLVLVGLAMPLAMLAGFSAAFLLDAHGDRVVAAFLSATGMLLLAFTPFLRLAVAPTKRLAAGFELTRVLHEFPFARSVALRAGALAGAAEDLLGWSALAVLLALVWSIWSPPILWLPWTFLVLCLLMGAWQSLLLALDLAILRWVRPAWSARLDVVGMLAFSMMSALPLAAAACLELEPVRGSILGASAAAGTLRWLPAWPLLGVVRALSLAWAEPAQAACHLAGAGLLAAAALWFLPLLAERGLRRGWLSLAEAGAAAPPTRRCLPRFLTGLALLSRPEAIDFVGAAVGAVCVAAASVYVPVESLWPLLAVAAALGCLGGGISSVRADVNALVSLALPLRWPDYLRSKSRIAALGVIPAFLTPPVLVHGTLPLSELAAPVLRLAAVACLVTYCSVALTAAFGASRVLTHGRVAAILTVLAALVGPFAAAQFRPDLFQAHFQLLPQALLLGLLWRRASRALRHAEDPEPPADPLGTVFAGTLFLCLVSWSLPHAAAAAAVLPRTPNPWATVVLLAALPAALGLGALVLGRRNLSLGSGCAWGAAAGLFTVALSAAYSAFGWATGWFDPERLEGVCAVLSSLDGSPEQFASAWFLIVLVAPAAEEAFFRGLLLTPLIGTAGFTRAALLTSALFASSHPVLHAPVTFGFGLLACLLRRRFGGLAAPILAHTVMNGATVGLGNVW